MSSKSKDPEVQVQQAAPEPIPVTAPAPTPTNVGSDIAKQMVTDEQKTKKGRSWSLLTRSGSDSRRTMLSQSSKLG